MAIHPAVVEQRVRDRLDRAKAGAPIEDSTIELKASWPNAEKAARRLAAHANASRGDPFTWIIGAKEDGSIVGASKDDLAKVLPGIVAHFDDSFAPECLRSDVIPYENGTVLAVTFASDRAPYVFLRGQDERDVPWREGTRTRSAKRHELLRMLVPTMALPTWAPVGLEVLFHGRGWQFTLMAEIVPHDKETVLLSRGSRLEVSIDGSSFQYPHAVVFGAMSTENRDDVFVRYSGAGAHLQGPAIVEMRGDIEGLKAPTSLQRIQIKGHVRIARSEAVLHFAAPFVPPIPVGTPLPHIVMLAPIVAMPTG